MNLDQTGRSSAELLHESRGAQLDVEALLDELLATHRRRRRERLALVALASACIVLCAWTVARPTLDGAAPVPPAHPSPAATEGAPLPRANGVLVGQFASPSGAGILRTVPLDDLPHPAQAWDFRSTEAFTSASWSRDGTAIAYTTAERIGIHHVGANLTDNLGLCQGCQVAWSPDGTHLAVTRPGRIELWSPTGGDRRVIIRLPDQGATQASWSPDGTRLVYVRIHTDSAGIVRTGLETVSVDTGTSSLLVADTDWTTLRSTSPTWSPDGAEIAVVRWTWSAARSQWQLAIVAIRVLDGSERVLSPDEGPCQCIGLNPVAAWSPDGTAIAVHTAKGTALVAVADGTRTPLRAQDAGPPLAWQSLPAPSGG